MHSRRSFLARAAALPALALGSTGPAQAWVEASGLRAAIDERAAPLSFVDPQHGVSGLAVDLFRSLARAEGMPVASITPMPWPDAVAAFKTKTIDILLAAVRTDERERYAIFTQPYHTLGTVMLSRLVGRHYQALSELSHAKVAILGQHFLVAQLQARYPDLTIVPTGTHADVLRAVAEGAAEVGIVHSDTVMKLLHDKFADRLAITGLLPDASAELAFMLQPELGAQRDALNHGLASLSPDTLVELRHRWLGDTGFVPPGGMMTWDKALKLGSPALTGAAALVAGSVGWTWAMRREVGRRRETEKALAASRDAQALAALQRKQFIAFLSHETRNIVAGMAGGLQLLEQAPTVGRRHAISRALQANTASLKQLLDASLDAAAIDAGQMSIKLGWISVPTLLHQIRDELMPLAQTRGLQLAVDIEGLEAAEIETDGVRLAQAVRNLAFNAIKFTRVGGIVLSARSAHVEAAESYQSGALSISVHDTGPGMSTDQLSRLFAPFGQLSDEARGSGTGLGLVISRELVRRLGGELSASSTPGQGSVFTIRLPEQRTVPTSVVKIAAQASPTN
jgi:two-component system, NarL family, sensor histidine kinase EvgS